MEVHTYEAACTAEVGAYSVARNAAVVQREGERERDREREGERERERW